MIRIPATMVQLAAAALAAAMLAGCSSSSSAPLSPAAATTAAAPEASLKASAPTVQSPINDARTSALSSIPLVAGAATLQYATVALQYRFQVFNDTTALVVDSGLMSGPAFTIATTLTPVKRYTWRVRAEYQGAAGPWSSTASFTTPPQPPAYNRPIGNWPVCAGLKSTLLVACVWNAVNPTDSVSDFEVVKRVAWLLRGDGGGLLIKNGGDNAVLWAGYSFSASRICFADGHIFKIIGDAGPGGANAPGFTDNDFVDKSLCVPAIDPSTP
ncbi:MAG TPA: hypothetical protein VKD69_10840 [Vicinamibacterales bacterium]|nr:hypothetical protein [Vicinamibacterales bacterium]